MANFAGFRILTLPLALLLAPRIGTNSEVNRTLIHTVG